MSCKTHYSDVHALRKLKIKNDLLMKKLTCHYNFEKYEKKFSFFPFSSYVTLALVTCPKAKQLAQRYILELLARPNEYGLLYLLADQEKNLAVKLNLNLSSARFVLDNEHYYEALSAIDKTAREIFNPETKPLHYKVTFVELLYFYVYLVNTDVNYVLADYVIGCIKSHRYLVAAPDRRVFKLDVTDI
jgi:hypothetical protein